MFKLLPIISKKSLIILLGVMLIVSMIFFISPRGVNGEPLSSAKAITSFCFVYGINNPQLNSQNTMVGIIDESNKTVFVNVPFGTDVTILKPTIYTTSVKLPSADRISPASNVVTNFTNPVIYTVTAEDGSTQAYTVTVAIAANTDKTITQFKFNNPLSIGIINESAKTIAVSVPYGTLLDCSLDADPAGTLSATVSIAGKRVVPRHGYAFVDYSVPVIYTVTAGDGSTQEYIVTVTAAAQPGSSAPPSDSSPLTPEDQALMDLSIAEQVEAYGATDCGFIRTCYDCILGRASDEQGFNDWATALSEGSIDIKTIILGFVFSEELECIISPAGPEEFIDFLYKHIFNREPDAGGYADWVTLMQNGMTKEEVLLHFIDSEEFKNICCGFNQKP